MYDIDNKDTVVPVPGAPPPDVGAPIPVVVANDGSVILAYVVSEPDPKWDGTYVTVLTPDSRELVATVDFQCPYAHMFGPPNDEAFDGHPLASRGLEPYTVSEVKCSSWVRRLERMNSVHHRHEPERILRLRHFVLAFHDSTFECVAGDISWRTERTTIREATLKMIERLKE